MLVNPPSPDWEPGCPAACELTEPSAAGIPAGSSCPAGAVSVALAVAVGAVVLSKEPKLDTLTGLVCIFSPVTDSGIWMFFAALAMGSARVVAAAGASRILLIWFAPRRLFSAFNAGLGETWRDISRARCSSWWRRSSAMAAAPVSGWGE